MRKLVVIAALVTTTLFILTNHPVSSRHRSVGLQVKIALAVQCKADLIAGEIVEVLRPGIVRLNSEELTLNELELRLQRTFRNSAQRIVVVSGGGELSFSDVVAVLEVALKHADYASLITPTVQHALATEPGNCLDPNIRFPQILM